jgi:coenzyme F420-0:L-glutamate ligase/coenzyme F420-1:gamma-L-glutamate ligase
MPEIIAIVGGSGAMGRALAFRWARAGRSVLLGSRDQARAASVAQELQVRVPASDIRGATNADAAARGTIVVLAVPYAHHREVLVEIALYLADKLLIDVTVPLAPGAAGTVSLPAAGCAAVEARQIVGESVDVVAAFQNIGAHLLSSDEPIDTDVLVSGDKPAARQRVIDLAYEAGLRAWHAGPLQNSAAAEALTSVLIQINKKYRCRSAGIRVVAPQASASETEAPDHLEATALEGLPSIRPGDDLADLIWQNLKEHRIALADDDILVVTQKVISKAEGRTIQLDSVTPSAEAQQIALETEKDPRLVQLVLDESKEVIRKKKGVIIVEHRLGVVMANAGVDQSNVPAGFALLLPKDPDASAGRLRDRLAALSKRRIAVIVSDSIGRAWRNGVSGHALGVAGLDPLLDLHGREDLHGRPLQVTQIAVADSIAATAALVMGEAGESKPVVLVRGYHFHSEHVGVQPLLRPKAEDLFR